MRKIEFTLTNNGKTDKVIREFHDNISDDELDKIAGEYRYDYAWFGWHEVEI